LQAIDACGIVAPMPRGMTRAVLTGGASMRTAMLLAATLLCGACGSMEYRDTNATVDANPLCTGSNSPRDGQPSTSTACDRKTEVGMSVGSKNNDPPLDLSGKHDD
jgi:hypothetical protein